MSERSYYQPGDGLNVLIELALLINLVSPGTLQEFPTASSTDKTPSDLALWHRFVNAIAWLADIRRGGKSVTAVCGVEIAGRPRLLLASNCGVKKEVEGHIRHVLGTLQGLINGATQNRADVLEDILVPSVHLSRSKVQNYSLRLSKLTQKLLESPERSSLERDSPLYREMSDFQSLSDQHHALCRWAYQYSKNREFGYLNEKCSSEPKIPLYHQIRHYIGRLGSWHRAASTLVLAATEIPNLVTGLGIEIVPQQLTAWRSADEQGSLRGLIEGLNLGLNIDHVLRKLQIIYSRTSQSQKERPDNLKQAFAAQLRDPKFRPTVHAEILLADYVHTGQLHFIKGDRYIGCSKPACVLCRLYLEAHPIQVSPPQCHGNLWPQWSPPLSVPGVANQHIDASVHSAMLHLRTFLWDRMMHGPTGSQRLPDSVTGITPTIKSGGINVHTEAGISIKTGSQ